MISSENNTTWNPSTAAGVERFARFLDEAMDEFKVSVRDFAGDKRDVEARAGYGDMGGTLSVEFEGYELYCTPQWEIDLKDLSCYGIPMRLICIGTDEEYGDEIADAFVPVNWTGYITIDAQVWLAAVRSVIAGVMMS